MILTWILLFTQLVQAQDRCAPKNFSAVLGPGRDQGQTEWCYAFAVADYIDFDRSKREKFIYKDGHRDRTSTSALDVVLCFNRKFQYKGDPWAGFGDAAGALEAVKLCGGACIDFAINIELSPRSAQNILQSAAESLSTQLKPASPGPTVVCNPPDAAIDDLKKLMRNITNSRLNEMLNVPKIESKRAIYKLDDVTCAAGRRRPVGVNREITNFRLGEEIAVDGVDRVFNKQDLLNEFDQQLDKNEILIVGYNALFLQGNPKGKPDDSYIPEGNHYNTVVGRRPSSDPAKKGQCEYLFRNTWGVDSCADVVIPSTRCERGNYWLTEDEIRSNAVQVVHF